MLGMSYTYTHDYFIYTCYNVYSLISSSSSWIFRPSRASHHTSNPPAFPLHRSCFPIPSFVLCFHVFSYHIVSPQSWSLYRLIYYEIYIFFFIQTYIIKNVNCFKMLQCTFGVWTLDSYIHYWILLIMNNNIGCI